MAYYSWFGGGGRGEGVGGRGWGSVFSDDLELYGPDAEVSARLSPGQSRRYCRRLARRHYENFTVVSWLLPRGLRQHVCNVYAYCRWSDDLADEVGDAGRSLELLDWWEGQLRLCYLGQASHPVFVALAETIAEYEIPAEPFADLLVAFRQDQRVSRYEGFEELLEYCRYSANPVGRLVLYLGRCCTPERAALADSICTGLQLANFWQDVARDYQRGRIYLPQSDCRRVGYGESDFAAGRCNRAFRELLAAKVAEAAGWLRRGLPLVAMMPAGLRLPVALFVRGGLAILEAIRRQDYDVWSSRPTVPKMRKLGIFGRCCWRVWRGAASEAEQ
jgi:squalene synthase HpnC